MLHVILVHFNVHLNFTLNILFILYFRGECCGRRRNERAGRTARRNHLERREKRPRPTSASERFTQKKTFKYKRHFVAIIEDTIKINYKVPNWTARTQLLFVTFQTPANEVFSQKLLQTRSSGFLKKKRKEKNIQHKTKSTTKTQSLLLI